MLACCLGLLAPRAVWATLAKEYYQGGVEAYQAGRLGYSEVIVAQVSALNARRSLAQVVSNRQTAAVALIQALGGGWEMTGR